MTQTDLLNQYAATRNAEAFAQIVEQYQRFVFSICRRKLHDQADIDDAVQETFLRLAQKAGELHSNVGGWLHRCAVNVAIDLNRRRSSRQKYESQAASSDVSDNAQETLAELREHLDAALEKLDAQQSELIIQRYFVGRPQVDLAAELNVSPSTITHRLDAAINSLRKHLQKMGCIAAGAGVAGLLESEAKSALVPQTLTANVMKIGLSGISSSVATVTTSFWWLQLAAMILVGLGLLGGAWFTTHRRPSNQLQAQTNGPAGLTVQANPAGDAAPQPHWQTTQPATESAVLSGRVLDHDGKPIAGASVSIQSGKPVTTDAQGNYSFKTIRNAGEYAIGVSAPGYLAIDPYRDNTPNVQLSPQSQARRDFVLERGVLVSINVADVTGQPIRGVTIFTGIPGDYRNRINDVDTNAAGQCSLTLPVSQTTYTLTTSLKGYAPAHQVVAPTSADKPIEADFVLGKGLTVTGYAICNDGKPATGWSIMALPDWWASGHLTYDAKIDAEGKFTLTDVVPGPNQIHVSIPEGNGTSTSKLLGVFTLPPTSQPWQVQIPMPSPGSLVKLVGKVKFIGGTPDRVEVQMESLGAARDFHMAFVETGRTQVGKKIPAGTGQFEMDNLPPGSYRVSFISESTETKVIEKFDVPGELPLIELKAIDKSHLTGAVVDAQSGKPVDHFAVRVVKLRTLGNGPNYVQDDKWLQVSDPQGKFSVDLVGPGVYKAQISTQGYAWTWSDELIVNSGDSPQTQIKLVTGGSMSGVVLDSSGKPLTGAKIVASDADEVQSDSQGRFNIPHVAARNHTLKITHPDFAPLNLKNFSITDGQSTDAGSLKLQVGGAIEGIVYDGQGNPLSGQTLEFQTDPYNHNGEEGMSRLALSSTDEKGHYRVEHLPIDVTYIKFTELWNHQGVVMQAVLPIGGQTMNVDFGGASVIKGRLVDVQHKAMPRVRLELATPRNPNFSSNMTFATTDDDGKFAFHGPPPGQYDLYFDSIGSNWIKIQPLEVTGQPHDLGDVVNDVGPMLIKLTADDPADLAKVQSITIQSNEPGESWHQVLDRAVQEGGNWKAANVPAGNILVGVFLKSDAGEFNFSVPAQRKPLAEQSEAEVHLPRATATLTIHMINLPKDQPDFNVRLQGDQGVEVWINSKLPTVKLPPGTYTSPSQKDLSPIVLKEGQSVETQVDVAAMDSKPSNGLLVRTWNSNGLYLPVRSIQLIGDDGKPIDPTSDDYVGKYFEASPGHYRVVVQPVQGDPITQETQIVASQQDKSREWTGQKIDVFVPPK